MKKASLVLGLTFLIAAGLNAQKDVRTNTTRIADLLAQMPAGNAADLNSAMKEMEPLGVDGLYQLSGQFVSGGRADNSKLQYAVMGYTAYVSAPGRDRLKADAEKAWIKALSNTNDKNLTSFFMSMLEIIGTNRSVAPLSTYLNDDMLGVKAAPVLAAIGTDAAGRALLNALTSNNILQKEVLLQALGNMKYAEALNQIESYVTNGKISEKRAAVFALAEIGMPASAGIILEQTKVNGKLFGNMDATADYSHYLQRLLQNGHKKEAEDLAKSFVKEAANTNVYAKTAALNALVLTQKGDALPTLAKAAYDNNPEYRGAALALAAPFVNSSNLSFFTKGLKKASPAVQTSLVEFLGNYHGAPVLKTITGFALKSKDAGLRHTSIVALGKTGGANAAGDLIAILKRSHEDDIPYLKQALLLVDDNNLPADLLSLLPGISGFQKALLISVLGEKRDKNAFGVVASALNSSDVRIKDAALAALPAVSGTPDIDQLFTMLSSASDQKQASAIQNAITTALALSPDAEDIVMNKLSQTPAAQQYLLFPALSNIGNKNALEKVYSYYKSSTGTAAEKAFETLVNWPGGDAMNALYDIATATGTSGDDKERALNGYIRLIPATQSPQAEQLLYLKQAMGVATGNTQKAQIIDQAGRMAGSFSALAFAAGYLDDPALRQTAAGAVMNVGLSDKSFYGTLVRRWLTKAMNVISGQDDIYMKKSIQKFLDDMPQREGYVSVFNGKDLTGWKGLVGNPVLRAKMNAGQLADARAKADSVMRSGWTVENGDLIFLGKGDNIATVKKYGDFEMLVDWKIFNDGQKDGDAGIYLRGTPQVQIWDTSRRDVGAQVGSGGLYNNRKHRSTPLKVADNPLGEWNHFKIKMIGDRVTVYLNGELVTDNVPLENYWDRNMPLWSEEQIELQAHGSRIGYRDIYIKELPGEQPFELSNEEKKEGYQILFDGTNLDNWQGNLTDYIVKDRELVIEPKPGSRGNLYTKKEYKDFDFRFEFKLTPGANNGVGIRAPLEGDAAYVGMEIQILDDGADIYKNLEKYQYHGSVYGVIPAKRGYLKPVGEWNYEEIIIRGNKIQVILNGQKIVDGDIKTAGRNGTMDKKPHPGLLNEKGYIGFLGHGSVVYFRNIRIKELN